MTRPNREIKMSTRALLPFGLAGALGVVGGLPRLTHNPLRRCLRNVPTSPAARVRTWVAW